MKNYNLKFIAENLIETFNIAGLSSIDLFKKGLVPYDIFLVF